jgi:hypothetical protein
MFLWLAFIVVAMTTAGFAYVMGLAGIGIGIAIGIGITMAYWFASNDLNAEDDRERRKN